ncbi:MAG: methyltransferase domain-containing protein [bacterium]
MTTNSKNLILDMETADIETSSDGYAARFTGSVGEWMLEMQEAMTVPLLLDRAGISVLDVGGGHGQLARPLCRRGFAVTVLGSDEVCRARISDLVDNGSCRFATGNLVALPFPDRSFDVVMSFRLLPHCVAWPVLIKELSRVARTTVIVDYPTSQGLNAIAPALFGAKKKMEGNTREWRMFRHAEVESEFAKYGFVPGRRNPQFFLPMVLHRMLKCRRVSVGLEAVCRALGLTRRWGSPVIAAFRKAS